MFKTMFLHFVPVDRVEYFLGFLGQERYVFMFLCFYVSRKQAGGHGLSVAYMIKVQNSQDQNSKRCYKIVTSELCALLQKIHSLMLCVKECMKQWEMF
jgi:hypothetical protein